MPVHLGKCAQATRILLMLLNILFLILGIGLIAGGSVLVSSGRTFEVFSGTISAVGISVLIIIAGIFAFIISALAILGAIFKSRVLLGIYLFVVVMIILIEVVVAIVGIVKRRDLGVALGNHVEYLIDLYGQNDTNARDAINTLQDTFHCCGWINYMDYTNRSLPIPTSCECSETVNCESVGSQSIWTVGCRDGVTGSLSGSIAVIIAVAIIFALVELIAVFFACGLCYCIHWEISVNKYAKV